MANMSPALRNHDEAPTRPRLEHVVSVSRCYSTLAQLMPQPSPEGLEGLVGEVLRRTSGESPEDVAMALGARVKWKKLRAAECGLDACLVPAKVGWAIYVDPMAKHSDCWLIGHELAHLLEGSRPGWFTQASRSVEAFCDAFGDEFCRQMGQSEWR